MHKLRSLLYLHAAIALLLYGVPKFQLGEITSQSYGFAIIWTFFAVLIFGANLYTLLGVEREKPPEQSSKVRRYQMR